MGIQTTGEYRYSDSTNFSASASGTIRGAASCALLQLPHILWPILVVAMAEVTEALPLSRMALAVAVAVDDAGDALWDDAGDALWWMIAPHEMIIPMAIWRCAKARETDSRPLCEPAPRHDHRS